MTQPCTGNDDDLQYALELNKLRGFLELHSRQLLYKRNVCVPHNRFSGSSSKSHLFSSVAMPTEKTSGVSLSGPNNLWNLRFASMFLVL